MEPVQQSLLQFYVSALGPTYLVLLPLAALVGFVVTLIVVIRGRGPMAVAALVLAAMLPLLVGIESTIDGMMASSMIFAKSAAQAKSSEVAHSVSMSLASLKVAFWLTAPIVLLAVVGSLARSLINNVQKGDGR
jgi:hypothetical protein